MQATECTGSDGAALSLVIPVFNDAEVLRSLLDDLKRFRPDLEVIVVDGGSDDNVEDAITTQHLVRTQLGRGQQLRFGAEIAKSPWIWMLHADSRVTPSMIQELDSVLHRPGWGCFQIQLSGRQVLFRLVESLMNIRSRISGICTGDMGIFVHRSLLDAIGGVPNIPLMEDIELSKRLRRLSRPIMLKTMIQSSSRTWERHGTWRTIIRMWIFRLRYFFGANPDTLSDEYRRSLRIGS